MQGAETALRERQLPLRIIVIPCCSRGLASLQKNHPRGPGPSASPKHIIGVGFQSGVSRMRYRLVFRPSS